MLNEARQYVSEGISVIPTNGKIPAVKFTEFRSRLATDDELIEWFRDTRHGIAAVTGVLSDLTVLDADTPEADAYVAENANTGQIVRTPSGGKHFHFKFKEYPNRTNLFDIGLDVRSEGGIAVLPPTPGYTWISRGVRGEIGNILPKIEQTKGEMQTYDAPVEKLIDRTLNYLKKLEPAVSGQHGHKRFYRAACVAVDRLGHLLSVEEIADVLHEYNMRCEPPFSDVEVRHKIEDSLKRS